MLCKIYNRERLPDDKGLLLERCAIHWVRKVLTEYRNFSGTDMYIRYLVLDVQEDLCIHVSAYSVVKGVAELAPEELANFMFVLRCDTEADLILPVEGLHDWPRRIAYHLHRSHTYWKKASFEDICKFSSADTRAYLLHRLCTGDMSDVDCAAIIKLLGMEESVE